MKSNRRVINAKRQIQANYDRLSHVYDWFTGAERKLQREALSRLNVKEGESVLEIGFGTGQSLVMLAYSVGNTGRVYGIDLSAGMLRAASAKITRAGLAGRVELRQADAVRLPYPDAGVDAVFISFTLELFDTSGISKVLKECRRVLRHGGRICLVALSNSKPGPALNIYEWAHRNLPSIIDCQPIYAYEELQKAGFVRIQSVQHSLWGLPVESILAVNPPIPAGQA